MKKTKQVVAVATIKKVVKEGKTFYNIIVDIDGFRVQCEPKFLNVKQKCLLKHKCAVVYGDENGK